MDFSKYQRSLSKKPWKRMAERAFFGFSVLCTVYFLRNGNGQLALLAGGGLICISLSQLLHKERNEASTILWLAGLVLYVCLLLFTNVVFPEVLIIFDGV